MSRKKIEITAKTRRLVRVLSGLGATWAFIAQEVGVSQRVLQDRCGDEFRQGAEDASLKVAKSLYKRAIEGDVGACCFWLKCRAKWREKDNENAAITPELVKTIIAGFASQLSNTQ